MIEAIRVWDPGLGRLGVNCFDQAFFRRNLSKGIFTIEIVEIFIRCYVLKSSLKYNKTAGWL